MSEILLEIESSLADQENSHNSIQLMLQNLKDDIQDALEDDAVNAPLGKISKQEIVDLLQENADVDIALVCPKCDNFLFANDTDAKHGKLTESSRECCYKYHKKSQEISRNNLDYWYHFLNSPFKTIHALPNYTRFLFYSTEGIPTQLRPRVWGMLLNSSDNFGNINNDWCEHLFQNLNDENSPYLRVIVNDLNRIFPGLAYFQNESLGQLNLKNILNAYSLYDGEIGYCQGLPFLIGLILFHFKSNPMTFLAAINIFEKKKNLNFKKLFDEKMSGLKLWFYQFDEVFKKHSPELYSHFQDLKIDLKLFTSKWFLSFFAVGCPMQILIKLFDIMIIEGFQSSIFKISLIILNKNKDFLLESNDAEDIHQHLLSKNIWDSYSNNLNLIINDLLNMKSDFVSQAFLDELEGKFNKHEAKRKFQLPSPKNLGHKHSKSSATAFTSVSLSVAVPKPSHEKSASVNLTATSTIDESPEREVGAINNTILAAPPAPAQLLKSVSNTPQDSESGFFKFFKYGFSSSTCPTPVTDTTPVNDTQANSTGSGSATKTINIENDKPSSASQSDRSSTCSNDSNIFDHVSQTECDSSNSSTTSPVPPNNDKLGHQGIVQDIIVSSPDMLLEKASFNNEKANAAPNATTSSSSAGLSVKQIPSASSSFSSASQLNEQIGYLSNIPPPTAKTSSGLPSSTISPVFANNAHSRSLSELNESTLPEELNRRPLHTKNYSISAFSMCSSTTDGTTFSNNSFGSSSLSPQSQMDSTFPSLASPSLNGFQQGCLSVANGGHSAHTGVSTSAPGHAPGHAHGYSPSISSIPGFNKKSRSEIRELDMTSEIESLKYKMEIYEKIVNDDKKLIKSLFKLYLMKDDLVDEQQVEEGFDKAKMLEKLKKKEYKVLKEVDERLRM